MKTPSPEPLLPLLKDDKLVISLTSSVLESFAGRHDKQSHDFCGSH